MNIVQRELIDLARKQVIKDLSLSEIGRLIKAKEGQHPQNVKYHLSKLAEKGIIKIERHGRRIHRVYLVRSHAEKFVPLPIVGSANCGEALQFADEYVEGYLMVSRSFLPKGAKDVYVLRAVGNSMNRASVNEEPIRNGDYVIVDGGNRDPRPDSYVVSVVDGMANIKRFMQEKDGTIVLASDSSEEFPPIYIHPDDFADYMISGEVIRVIKSQAKAKAVVGK